ncbi:glycoside hydrolase family 75 protein [Streptomyces sp. IBSBF 2807]|nr:glycoside hydrolase family 75 protein [Streptomyces hilarionis]
MRVKSLTLAAAGLALLAPATPSVAARPSPAAAGSSSSRQEGSVRAADLLARVRDCAPVSRGRYRTDDDMPATVPVCGTDEAVFWTADMDIDCDGRPGPHCNSGTDPLFSEATAFQQSDGRYLSAEELPYIVVPGVSAVWDHRAHGVGGGSVAAVVYGDRVEYAVVGDVGPREIIGEASYATARALGIRADPHGGGTPSGVTYIVFRNARATPIESHASAVAVGERLARAFVQGGGAGATTTPAPSAPAPSAPPATDAGAAAREEAAEDDWTPNTEPESEEPLETPDGTDGGAATTPHPGAGNGEGPGQDDGDG